MTDKQLIREKIDVLYTEYKDKFHQNGDSYYLGIIDGLDIAERILDSLPDEPDIDGFAKLSYNELMDSYKKIREELIRRQNLSPVDIKEMPYE